MRLPRVLRALRPELPEFDPHANLRVTIGDDPHRAVYGSEQPRDWQPPHPHADATVHLGENVHRTRYAPEGKPAPSVAEQIDALVRRSHP